LLPEPRTRTFGAMTKLLERALEAARQLPLDDQDEVARAVLSLIGDDAELEEIDPAHLLGVLEGLAQAKRREFSSDEEVEAAFRRFDP
jgi:Ca2+-binding EF-hand superfamily protein